MHQFLDSVVLTSTSPESVCLSLKRLSDSNSPLLRLTALAQEVFPVSVATVHLPNELVFLPSTVIQHLSCRLYFRSCKLVLYLLSLLLDFSKDSELPTL